MYEFTFVCMPNTVDALQQSQLMLNNYGEDGWAVVGTHLTSTAGMSQIVWTLQREVRR